MYGFNPINITKRDPDKEYDSNVIFYMVDNISNIFQRFNDGLIDGIFIMRTNNNRFITETNENKDIIFLNMTFDNTIFDKLFSLYFYKKQLQIETSVDAHEDLLSQSSFETRMTRILLVTNSFMKDDIGARLCELYFQHNNYIINALTNQSNKSNKYNQYFEPIDLIHINKNIMYDYHTKNYLQKLGFLLVNPTPNQLKDAEINDLDKYKYYWKYDKIGINKFKLN